MDGEQPSALPNGKFATQVLHDALLFVQERERAVRSGEEYGDRTWSAG